MRSWRFLVAILASCAGLAAVAAASDERGPRLRVLYVGNTDSDRGRAYAKFLGEAFTLVGAADRKTFNPKSAGVEAADVVVLDWSQSDIQHTEVRDPGGLEANLKSPLGERNRWSKPTVLLGSAGHLLAAPWKVFGGSG
jgi:hypothetical protein